jgi:hypothetical protein
MVATAGFLAILFPRYLSDATAFPPVTQRNRIPLVKAPHHAEPGDFGPAFTPKRGGPEAD